MLLGMSSSFKFINVLCLLSLLSMSACFKNEGSAERDGSSSCQSCVSYPPGPSFHLDLENLTYPEGKALLLYSGKVDVISDSLDVASWEVGVPVEDVDFVDQGLVVKTQFGEIVYLQDSGSAETIFEYYSAQSVSFIGESSIGLLVFSDGTVYDPVSASSSKLALPSNRPVLGVRQMSKDMLVVETGLDDFRSLVLYQMASDIEAEMANCNGASAEALSATHALLDDCNQPILDVSTDTRSSANIPMSNFASASVVDGAIVLSRAPLGLFHLDATGAKTDLFTGQLALVNTLKSLKVSGNNIVVREKAGLAHIIRGVDAKQSFLTNLIVDEYAVKGDEVFYSGLLNGEYVQGVYDLSTALDTPTEFEGQLDAIVPIPVP